MEALVTLFYSLFPLLILLAGLGLLVVLVRCVFAAIANSRQQARDDADQQIRLQAELLSELKALRADLSRKSTDAP